MLDIYTRQFGCIRISLFQITQFIKLIINDMKIETKLSTQNTSNSSICKQCGRELPQEFFYVNRQTQCLDIYCKGCRKEISRRRYNSGNWIRKEQRNRYSHLVITQVEDPLVRMELILHALKVVRQSVEHKRMKILEEEANRTDYV